MDQTNPKPFVFVLMPFRPELDDIYQLGIKAACVSAGAYCERVDEQIFVENILERVYNQIAKADIIVAEMTGRNPNVFYETGYAHALNKRVVLFTQNSDDIPFDLKHYPHIVYGGKITLLKSELEKRIRWCIDNPTRTLTSVNLDFEFLVNGISVHERPNIEVPCRLARSEERPVFPGRITNGFMIGDFVFFSIQVDIRNISSRIVDSHNYRLALIVPAIFHLVESNLMMRGIEVLITADPTVAMVRVEPPDTLFPDEQTILNLSFVIAWKEWVEWVSHMSHGLVLRLYGELGPKDFPFQVIFAFHEDWNFP